MTRTDTIVAAATPPGRGGVGIVRFSGPKTPELAAILLGELPPPRHATFARFLDAQQDPIDAGLALFFPAPHSYTGEHVLELHGHGGPLVMEALVGRALELGARRAHAGEFTQRAFLNDKLDLAQAEAIADLIDAGSRAAVRAAMRSLQGEFSAMVRGLTEAVIELRTYVEAAIDFPEEEIDFLADRRQVEPAQPPGRLRRGDRHASARHHARCGARAHSPRWHAAARARHRGAAPRRRCRRGGGHPACPGGDAARRSRAVRHRRGGGSGRHRGAPGACAAAGGRAA